MEGNDESLYCHGNLIIPLFMRGMIRLPWQYKLSSFPSTVLTPPISSTSCSMESSISLFSSRFVETECSYQFDLTVYPRSVMSDKRMLSAVLYVVSCI